MAASRYRKFLRLIEEWPVDPSKRGRDLAAHLRKRVAKDFSKGESTKVCCKCNVFVIKITQFCGAQKCRNKKPSQKTLMSHTVTVSVSVTARQHNGQSQVTRALTKNLLHCAHSMTSHWSTRPVLGRSTGFPIFLRKKIVWYHWKAYLKRKSFRMAPPLFHSIWNNIVFNLPQWDIPFCKYEWKSGGAIRKVIRI